MDKAYDYFSAETRDALENLPEDLLIFLYRDGQVSCILATRLLTNEVHVNFQDVFKFYQEHPFDILHPDDKATFNGQVALAAEHPGRRYIVRIRLRLSENAPYIHISGELTAGAENGGAQLLYMRNLKRDASVLDGSSADDDEKLKKLMLDKVLETTSDCIFWKDRQRRFVGVNQAFLKFYGFSSDSILIGKTDEDMGWHPDPEPYRRDEMRVLNGESTLLVHGTCIIHGEVRDILATKAPVYDGNKIIGLVGSFIDVTEDYRRRKQIERLDGQLKDALKKEKKTNEDLNLFMSRVSHELRTPMNAVIGLSSLGMETDDLNEAIDCLHKINASGEYLLSIINDVLDINKMGGGKFKLHETPCTLTDIVEAVRTIIQPLADKKKIHFHIYTHGVHEDHIICDKVRIEQILVNLLNNAVKFTEPGGIVSLTLNEETVGDRVRLTAGIRDNGCGMSAEFLGRIFQPFEQENRNPAKYGTGTGLGLTISRNLARQMNGDISVQSTEGEGSTFTAAVMIGADREYRNRQEHDAAEAADKEKQLTDTLKGMRVLVADDNELNREIAGEILKTAGITSEYAADGEEALEMYESSPDGHFDALLIDLIMPVMDGYTAASQIRSLHRMEAKTIPMIAVSADIFGDSIQRAKDHGFNDFVSKPIERGKLLAALARVTAKRGS